MVLDGILLQMCSLYEILYSNILHVIFIWNIIENILMLNKTRNSNVFAKDCPSMIYMN